MLEVILKEGSSPGFLPRNEASHGSGTLCQNNITNASYYGARYLPFAPNGINWIEHQQDVISYNFTGCIMAFFNYKNVNRVCHVSTGAGQDCLAEWKKIKQASANVFEFRPSDFIDTKGLGAFSGCYGLITSDLRTFAITVVTNKKNELMISSIKKAHLLRS